MITFIVPCYNEAGNIAATVATIRAAVAQTDLTSIEVILVDDGSTDGTSVEIEGLVASHTDVRSIRHPSNQGLGATIRAGIASATAASFVVVPGDNDVSREMLALMLSVRNEADMILVVPLNKELRGPARNAVSMLYQMAYMVVFRVYVGYISGPGIWPTATARAVGLRSRRFSIISELNVKLLRSAGTYAEVPGYLQAGPKTRRTVTLRNLSEVVVSFVWLMFDIFVANRTRFRSVAKRKQIELVRRSPNSRA